MAIQQAILDTDILSSIMRKHPKAIAKSRLYLAEHGRFTISLITRYEILRGLKAKNATRQITRFNLLCKQTNILLLTNDIIDRASDIYADLSSRGEMIQDADILIAATALKHGIGVVTNNEDHFRRIQDLYVENWLE